MLIAISRDEVVRLVTKQLDTLLIFNRHNELTVLSKAIDKALEKAEFCFSFIRNEFYRKGNNVYFNPFHQGQYASFLYFVSNILFRNYQATSLAERVFYLNKILNAVDLYYEVMLPDIFFPMHPMGSVMGRANYANFFCFLQNCSVGSNKDVYPSFGENVILYSGVTVIGNSNIGDHCVLSANTYVKEQDVPAHSLVFGSSPNLVIKHKTESDLIKMTSNIWLRPGATVSDRDAIRKDTGV